LHYLPFAALADPAMLADRRSAKGEYRPLIVDHEIVSLPSASTLVALRSETAGIRQYSKTVAVIADPVFSPDDLRVRDARNGSKFFAQTSSRAVRTARRGAFLSRLPFTREEAENITAVAPPESSMKILDFASNRAAVLDESLARYRFIHLATHGWMDSSRPEMSGLVLSLVDERGQWQEGFLGLGDIYNLRLPVEMIVLSACRTALGREISGEGIVGLTRGFMYAGARRVMASLWKVDDFATAQLMKRVYGRILNQGETPAAALRSAQREMWQQPQWRHPYFWAAFSLQGEWN
jgi:CHAT domain-containing protein